MIIAYCHTGQVHSRFMESVVSALLTDREERRILNRVIATSSAYIPEARNSAVGTFLQHDEEWLLFLDYDVEFDPHAPYALLDAADSVERPIIGGLYFVNLEAGIAPVFYVGEGDELEPLWSFTTGQVIPISSTGLGLTLIHRSVLERVHRANRGPWHWFGHDQINGHLLGEDLSFFRRVRELGIPVHGHTGVLARHHKRTAIGIDDYAQREEVSRR